MIYVYVAGPISKGDMAENVGLGIRMGLELLKRGYIPYIPHLDLLLRIVRPISWDECLTWDEAWVAKCDVLIRLPGESRGADREEQFCNRHEIPVFRMDAQNSMEYELNQFDRFCAFFWPERCSNVHRSSEEGC